MRATLMPVATLLLSVAILLMGNGLQGVLLPIRAGIEVFSTFDIGIMGSSYYVGFVIGCFLGVRIVRRVGHVRAFTAMVSIASTIALLHALLPVPALWWIFRAATGFCFATLFMIIESWLNEKATNQTRGKIFSVYTIINLTVVTLGQLMVTLHDPASFPLFALASILVSLAAVPVALSTSPAPEPIKQKAFSLTHLFRVSPVGLVGCFAVGLTNGGFWALAPVFAQAIGLTTTGVALFMSTTVIGGAIGQWPLGFASDQIDRRKVIIFACLGSIAASAAMIVFDDLWVRGILIFAFLFGIFAFPLYSLSAAHMNDFVEPDEFVQASSGLLLMFGIGAVIGPLVAAAAMTQLGPDGLYIFVLAIHLALAAYTVRRLFARPPPPEEERVAFADSLRSVQTVMPLEPTAQNPD